MINNLNRVKRILSARLGAEIPKFLGGYKIYHKTTGKPLYSRDNQTWYEDLGYKIPFYGNIIEYSESGLLTNIYDPNAIIKDSQQKVQNIAQKVFETTELKQNVLKAIDQFIINNTPSTLNTTLPTRSVNNVTSQNNNLAIYRNAQDAHKVAMQSSADLRLSEEDLKLSDQMLQKLAEKGQAFMSGMDAISAVGGVFGAAQLATDSNLTKGISAGYDGIATAASSFGPMGEVIGGAMKALGALGDMSQAMGGGTDQQTATDKWMDSSLLSWNVGMINGFFGKNSDSFGIDLDTLSQVGSSYGGTTSSITEAADSADKKYGLFSSKARKKANTAIANAKVTQNAMSNIANTAEDQRLAVQSMGEQAGLAYSLMTDGGYNLKYTYAAKQGGILEWEPDVKLEWEPLVELNWELPKFKEGGNIDIIEELEWIPEFKSGGKTEEFDIPEIEETNLKNVIPEGALHKNKHHMEHAEGLTKKGIPVIDEEGEQLAEIEHSEIIFTLEVTKKLEEYYQIFYSEESTNKEKEQAALNAGKLLVYQILENTEDRTGLIESCKKGGSLILKKSTDDLIEEVLEWMPTITIIEEVIEEPKKTFKKDSEKELKKSEKELMKEAIKEVLIEILTK